MTTLSQRRGWRCHNVVRRSKMRVVATSVSDVVTTSLFNVVKMLAQRHDNIKQLVSRPFNYRQFWFLSRHRNVRELPKYLSIESSLWQATRTLVNSWLPLLLVCEKDKETWQRKETTSAQHLWFVSWHSNSSRQMKSSRWMDVKHTHIVSL